MDTQDTHFLLVMITTRQEVGRRVSRRVTRCHPTSFKLFRFFIRRKFKFSFFGGKLDKFCAVAPIQKVREPCPFYYYWSATQHAQRGGGEGVVVIVKETFPSSSLSSSSWVKSKSRNVVICLFASTHATLHFLIVSRHVFNRLSKWFSRRKRKLNSSWFNSPPPSLKRKRMG